jgi:ketosteroid isomerase-like protein
MIRTMGMAALTLGLALALSWQGQGQAQWRDACVQRCLTETSNPELHSQEIISLEKEGAHAIQLGDATFFRRVYSEDYAGTLSHGQQVNRPQWIEAIQSPFVKYESFLTSDIKVRTFGDTAIATCIWSSRSIVNGQRVSSQMRVVHVYVNYQGGWHIVTGQATNLPPDVQQPL